MEIYINWKDVLGNNIYHMVEYTREYDLPGGQDISQDRINKGRLY